MICQYCDSKNDDNAKFCNNCGKSLVGSSNDESKKNRIVHKCPNCGETLDAFVTKCKTCGYELREINVNSSLSNLVKKLNAINAKKTHFGYNQYRKEEEMASEVKNFLIPNTKEDILELMIMASSNIDLNALQKVDEFGYKLSSAWFSKMEQAYNKAKISLVKDSSFSQIEDIYKRIESEINRKRKKEMDEKKLQYILMILGIVLSFIILMTLIIFGAMGKF